MHASHHHVCMKATNEVAKTIMFQSFLLTVNIWIHSHPLQMILSRIPGWTTEKACSLNFSSSLYFVTCNMKNTFRVILLLYLGEVRISQMGVKTYPSKNLDSFKRLNSSNIHFSIHTYLGIEDLTTCHYNWYCYMHLWSAFLFIFILLRHFSVVWAASMASAWWWQQTYLLLPIELIII